MNKGNRTKRNDLTAGTSGPILNNEDFRSDALSNFHDYLAMVQERNRRLKSLQTKDPKQIEMERREQGFTLYVNGANINLPSGQVIGKNIPRQRERSRAKTAEKFRGTGKNVVSDAEFYDNPCRTVKTAPEKPRRRKWQIRSVEIRTNSGESVRIKPPVILTGKYSDDFEEEMPADDGSDDDDDDFEEEDMCGGDDCDNQMNDCVKPNSKDTVERVSLTIGDVKKLRRSLELSSSLRESLQKDVSVSKSCLMGESIEEEINFPRGSYSESHLVDGKIRDSMDHPCEQILKANDIIVLELASNKNPCKSEKQLTAAKRKNSDSTESLPNERRTPRGSGGSRTPREERARERLSTEDIRVQKSKEILLRPVSDAGAMKSKIHFREAAASKSSDSSMDSPEHSYAVVEDIAAEKSTQDKKLSSNHSNQEMLVERINLIDVIGDENDDLQPSSSSPSSLLAPELQLELGGGSMNELVQKVLLLDPSGQQQLLKALQDIEQGFSMSLKPAWSNRPTELLDKNEAARGIKSADKIKICICIFSNWGHPGRVGLTGIELFDMSRRRIEIHSTDVQIQGAKNVNGDFMALFNGKYKTVKESNMWSCDLQSLNPIRISIMLKNHHPDDSNFGISKLKIWNFNKNAGELNKGVKNLKILIDGDVVFFGDLDKGCGNHVFDYGKVIDLVNKSDIGSGSPKSGLTATDNKNRKLASSNSDWLHLQNSNKTGSHEQAATDLQERETEISKMPLKCSDFDGKKSKQKNSSKDSKSKEHVDDERWLPNNSNALAQEIDDVLSLKDQLSEQKQKKEPPSWLTENADKQETSEFNLPLTSGSHKKLGQDGILANQWPDLELEDILEIRDVASRNSNKDWKSNEKMKNLEKDSSQNRENSRAKWNVKPEKSLEESWLSLTLFNRFQKGRLSVDLEDDALDEYLLPPKTKQEPTIIEESIDNLSDGFVIPELPSGQELVISILSTWGDHHYVGLNGIEVFTDTGEPAPIAKISADPADINVLPEYSGDPRVVANLIDGINRTRDDTHMWLAPFTCGQKHFVSITFQKAVKISLLRIWNYNKSRIHSSRGAKDIEVSLDGHLIFVGEIARSSGGIAGSSEAFGDTILFTTDEDVLELVSHYDQMFEVDIEDEDPGRGMTERPKTADKGEEKSRPFTSASHLLKKQEKPIENSGNTTAMMHDHVLKGRSLQLNLTATWGDIHYLGLTGIEVLDKNSESIPLTIDMISANPRDLHILPGYEMDDRTLDKLINGVNVTSSDEHMWLIPFTEGEDHYIQFDFSQPTEITGLRIWNYNKSPEDTFRGARIMHVNLDGRCISPSDGFLIRKGPGNCFFDFAQEVRFNNSRASNPASEQKSDLILPVSDMSNEEYEVIQKPCGFIYQLQLLSSWGDPYYLGLNGLEFYDANGLKINLTENNVAAYPDSVNVLDGIENDVRTPDKLVDGIYDTQDGRHMWLAPILPNILNRVYIIFDSPVELSMIKIWNYSKLPNRGVKDIAVLVDDLLVYNGTLDMVPVHATGIIPTVSVPQRYHTILFTSNKAIVQGVKHTVIRNQAMEQEVQLTNDHKVVAANKRMTKPVDQALRPTTSVPAHQKRSNHHR